jgi:hypothetical protein
MVEMCATFCAFPVILIVGKTKLILQPCSAIGAFGTIIFLDNTIFVVTITVMKLGTAG